MAKIYEFLRKIISLFPQDPLAEVVAGIEPLEILGYINYFVPVSQLVLITKAWVVGVVGARVAMVIYKIIMKKL